MKWVGRKRRLAIILAVSALMIAGVSLAQRPSWKPPFTSSEAVGKMPTEQTSGGFSFFARWLDEIVKLKADRPLVESYIDTLQNVLAQCALSPVARIETQGVLPGRAIWLYTQGSCTAPEGGGPWQVMFTLRYESDLRMPLLCQSFHGQKQPRETDFCLAEIGCGTSDAMASWGAGLRTAVPPKDAQCDTADRDVTGSVIEGMRQVVTRVDVMNQPRPKPLSERMECTRTCWNNDPDGNWSSCEAQCSHLPLN